MAIEQLDFFYKPSEIEILREEIKLAKESNERVRKGIYAKHGELAKMFLQLEERLTHIERGICKNGK